MPSEERILFKDKITKKEYTVLAKELLNAIDMGEDALKKVLIGCENPELYSSHGTYQKGGHNRCGGLKGNRFTEKRFCKCLYYRNGKYHNPDECRECDFADRFDITGNYQIMDYEVPAYFYGKGIGEIDLIISDGKTQYATELKPDKVGMMAGLFFGLNFGLGGIGSAFFGWLADKTSIEFIFQISTLLPLLGMVTVFLPNIDGRRVMR